MCMKFVKLDFDNVYGLAEIVACKIRERYGDEKLRDVVLVAVSRGGLVPARIIADLLEKEEVYCIAYRSYTGIGKQEEGKLLQGLDIELKDREVIICDDIVDSGNTIRKLKEALTIKGARVKTAVLHWKESSSEKPDFFAARCEKDTWIVYPWELHEFGKILANKKGESLEDI